MLTSLFGDLGPRDGKNKPRDFDDTQPDSQGGFAATAIMESVATEVNERGQIIDRHVSDLVVTGSPAQAIREHFAATRPDLDTASSMITLLDPVGVWASSVVKALSDAGGRPIERLHLREKTTLRTIAMIERTTLVRRQEDTLRIFHADVRAPGPENAEIPVALMERSQMTAVIIGPMQPHAIDALLASLRQATSLPTWRCPQLLFQLPPNATWIDNKVQRDGLAAAPARAHRQRADDRRVVGLERDARRLERGQAAAGLGSDGGVADPRHRRLPDQGRRDRRHGDPGQGCGRGRADRRRRHRLGAAAHARRARRHPRPAGARQPAQARRPDRLRPGRRRHRPGDGARDPRRAVDRHGARGRGCGSGAARPARRGAQHGAHAIRSTS